MAESKFAKLHQIRSRSDTKHQEPVRTSDCLKL